MSDQTHEARQLTEGHRDNFETLRRAMGNHDVALMACRDRQDGGRFVAVVCAVAHSTGGQYVFTPLALMLPQAEENPFDRFAPPGSPDNE